MSPIRISDLENGLLNLERPFERLLRQFAKKYPEAFKSLDPNVFAFGLVLYEMATATALTNLSELEKYPANASKTVFEVLPKFTLESRSLHFILPSLDHSTNLRG